MEKWIGGVQELVWYGMSWESAMAFGRWNGLTIFQPGGIRRQIKHTDPHMKALSPSA